MPNDSNISISCVKPYDFALSLRVIRSFQQNIPNQALVLAAKIEGHPAIIKVTGHNGKKGDLKASSRPAENNDRVRAIVEWVLFADLDLSPFYRLVSGNSKLAPVIQRLHGLKPMRPVSLFEMAVIAITEQQLSLASAYKIRERIVKRYGESIGDQWVFPEPDALASTSLAELRSCGLSKQKAEYIQDIAAKVVTGSLDLDSLKLMDDDQARETLMSLRGFGRWSADYILVRGLARPDCIPIDDLGIRDVVGKYLGKGQRITSQEVAEKLERFRPYRGLLAFYLLADNRLNSLDGN